MSDIKLFRTDNDHVEALEGRAVAIEKSLQKLIEKNLETFLGVRFIASEYSTGKKHGGRIDTLGIDENGSPVIIEYKRSINDNVINQGLYYLDWLLDHKGEFTLEVLKRYGQKTSENIEWENARLLCVAGNFTKYDQYAVEQISRNIELIRYRRYGDEFLLLELVNATSSEVSDSDLPTEREKKYSTVTELLDKASPEMHDRLEALKAFALALGDDVQMKTLKFYFAYRRLKNFLCIEVRPQAGTLVLFVKVDPDTITLEDGFTRDVRDIGHFGTGDLEITISTDEDIERAHPLILRSYEAS